MAQCGVLVRRLGGAGDFSNRLVRRAASYRAGDCVCHAHRLPFLTGQARPTVVVSKRGDGDGGHRTALRAVRWQVRAVALADHDRVAADHCNISVGL